MRQKVLVMSIEGTCYWVRLHEDCGPPLVSAEFLSSTIFNIRLFLKLSTVQWNFNYSNIISLSNRFYWILNYNLFPTDKRNESFK